MDAIRFGMTGVLFRGLEKARREVSIYDLAVAATNDTVARWEMWQYRRRWARVVQWVVARVTAPRHIREVEHVFPEDEVT